jgi:hypothetical protein
MFSTVHLLSLAITTAVGFLLKILFEPSLKDFWRHLVLWSSPPPEAAASVKDSQALEAVAQARKYCETLCGSEPTLEAQLNRLEARRRELRLDTSALASLEHNRLLLTLFHMPFLEATPLLDGRFQLDRKLADGEITQIWKALDQATQEAVAVKILRYAYSGDTSVVEHFSRTADLLAKIAVGQPVPQFVRSASISPEQGLPLYYYAMGYVDGSTLAEPVVRSRDDRYALARKLTELGHVLGMLHAPHGPRRSCAVPQDGLEA